MNSPYRPPARPALGPLVLIALVVCVVAAAFAYTAGWFSPERITPNKVVDALAPPGGPEVAATAEYGTPVAAVVARRNIMATQFHCEKSGPAGLGLLKTFTGLTREELCR